MSTSPQVVIGPFVVGEKPAPLIYTFQDSNGNALDITGYTAKFHYKEQNGSYVEQAATLVNPTTSGQVQYQWTGVEFPTPGHYLAEFWVGNLTQRFASWLIEFDVRAAIGVVPNI